VFAVIKAHGGVARFERDAPVVQVARGRPARRERRAAALALVRSGDEAGLRPYLLKA
jgi:hypothetical protein